MPSKLFHLEALGVELAYRLAVGDDAAEVERNGVEDRFGRHGPLSGKRRGATGHQEARGWPVVIIAGVRPDRTNLLATPRRPRRSGPSFGEQHVGAWFARCVSSARPSPPTTRGFSGEQGPCASPSSWPARRLARSASRRAGPRSARRRARSRPYQRLLEQALRRLLAAEPHTTSTRRSGGA